MLKNEEVLVPFTCTIPAGSSDFVIPVDTRYQKYNFSFAKLVLTPEFYNDEAALLNIDVPEEDNVLEKYSLGFKVSFETNYPLYPESRYSVNSMKWDAYVSGVNSYFDLHKPTDFFRPGFFIDWIDFRASTFHSWEEYIRFNAKTLYGVEYNPHVHKNVLPESVRNMTGINNFLFPTQMDQYENQQKIRFRLNIAPNMIAFFSSVQIVEQMGFHDENFIVDKQQVLFSNNSKRSWYQVESRKPIEEDKFIKKDFKTGCRVNNQNYLSKIMQFSLRHLDSLKNMNYEGLINNVCNELAISSNIKFEIIYKKDLKTFQFLFPDSSKFRLFKIIISKNLAERLGFGLVDTIDKAHEKGREVPEFVDFDAKKFAVVLCNDTNMVVVSDNQNQGSILTSAVGIQSKTLAILFATENGTMSTANEICDTAPSIIMRPHGSDIQSGKYFFPFRMFRSYEDNRFDRFTWNVGAKVNGFMRGQKMAAEQHQILPL